jgi:phage terminase large subunit GpA-like protein
VHDLLEDELHAALAQSGGGARRMSDGEAILDRFTGAIAGRGELCGSSWRRRRCSTSPSGPSSTAASPSTESAEPGPYRVTRTPYAREPQDCMSRAQPVEEVVLMWAAQTSKTTVMLNCLGAAIGTNPGPIMIVWPTNTVAKRNSRQRVAPLLSESEQLAGKVAANRSRDKANTTMLKEFDGGILVIAGANSAADLRSTPVRDLYLDEVDNFPLDVDGEGDPSKLAEARQTTFARRKRLRSSTPTTKGFSRIESAFDGSDRCRYHVPCPHCGTFQALEFGADKAHGLKWDKGPDGAPLIATVRYVCAAGGCEIREHEKGTMLARGVWVAENPGAQNGKVRGFHLSGLYSPLGWLSWRQVALEWHEAMQAVARGDLTLLRVFVNTRLAETFEEQGDKADEHALKRRAAPDLPLRQVHRACYVCTMGIDVQGDRLEAYVWAWGRGMERQLVDRAIFYGDPSRPEDEPDRPGRRSPSTGARRSCTRAARPCRCWPASSTRAATTRRPSTRTRARTRSSTSTP